MVPPVCFGQDIVEVVFSDPGVMVDESPEFWWPVLEKLQGISGRWIVLNSKPCLDFVPLWMYVAVDHFDGLVPFIGLPNSLSLDADAFIRAHNAQSIFARPGLRFGPRWRSLRCPQRPPNRLGRGYTIPLLLDAFDASNSPEFLSKNLWSPYFKLIWWQRYRWKSDTVSGSVAAPGF